MASALDTLDAMNIHHGGGVGAYALGTVAGYGASVGLGTLYAAKHDKWYGKYSPYLLAAVGKLGALATVLATGGGSTFGHFAAVTLNDIGQAGVNALGLHHGVLLGMKISGKTPADLIGESIEGYTGIAGELPPAQPGRSLEDISVEDLANLQ